MGVSKDGGRLGGGVVWGDCSDEDDDCGPNVDVGVLVDYKLGNLPEVREVEVAFLYAQANCR
jgi:hypothetical protein